MIVNLTQFKGIAPKITPVDLPQQAAQTALNCLFGSGALRPLVNEANVLSSGDSQLNVGTKSAIFKYGNYWLNWVAGADVNVCRSSVAMDSFDRLYWTGDGAPKMGDNTIITSGTAKPGGSYNLGIPKPAAAPSVAKTGDPGDPINDETRAYVYTYVSAYGEEGPPSTPSANITLSPGNTIQISGMSVAPVGAYNIASKNIYRVNAGSSASEYQYVGTVAVATTTYNDTKEASLLGEVLPSATWIAPNATMAGLITHPGGFLVGHYKNVLCFSEPFLPHAWPAGYQITVDAEIVAIGAFGNSILGTTKGMPYIVTGAVPGQMSVEKLEKGESCILKRGLVDMGYACIYPGPSGLWLAGTGSVELATQALMTKKEWATYSASLVFAVQYESLYIGFMSSGGFVFDTSTGDLSTHDITATAGWYDREAGRLYLVVGGAIVEWSAGSGTHALTWKSKKIQVPSPHNFGAAQVFAAGTVTAKVYADGVLKATQSVTDSKPFRLPSGFRATCWEMQLEGSYEITSAVLASTLSELAQV